MYRESANEPRMSSSLTYQIKVKGRLGEHWAEWFNGTLVNFKHSHAKSPHTILTCRVRDQAELYGILYRLTSLNVVLIQVTLLKEKGENHVGKPQ